MQPIVNLFIVGAPKCGTTALAHNLSATKRVYSPSLKEPNYFVKLSFHNAPHIRDAKSYNRLFSQFDSSCDYYLDASTSYLFDPDAASRINRYNDKAKIIILLKDPVERMISHYNMEKYVYRREHLNIRSAFKRSNKHDYFGFSVNPYIEPSLYYNQVKRYLEVFDRQNIFIGIVDLSNDYIKDLQEFLDIAFIPSKRINESKKIRNKFLASLLKQKYLKKYRRFLPKYFKTFVGSKILFKSHLKESITEEIKREYYNDFFHEDIQKLEGLLNVNLDHWKR